MKNPTSMGVTGVLFLFLACGPAPATDQPFGEVDPASEFTSLELGSSGFPVRRRQTVHFPTGDMEVEEEYFQIVINP